MKQGSGLLFLWNDIDPSVDVEYQRWHAMEHVPERVTVPGILAGRRYVKTDGLGQRYFSLYELDSTAVLASPAYLALVDGPTPWSQRMRVFFSNITRFACHRIASAGSGLGASLLTIRVQGSARENNQTLVANVLGACTAIDGIVAAHWCAIDNGVPSLSWQSSSATSDPYQQVLLVEATDLSTLRAARAKLEGLARHAGGDAKTLCGAEYALLQVVHPSDQR
ncbi:MAG: hypothetical protein ACKVQK_26970 [Burkholderiales bacterium]